MKTDRLTRVNEQMRREIGTALYRLLGNSSMDLAAITVTHVFASSDLRTARVLISIRDHKDERATMLAFLNRHHADIQAHVAKHMILKYTPRLKFCLDESIEKGDQILSILDHLKPADPAPMGLDEDSPSPDFPEETGKE